MKIVKVRELQGEEIKTKIAEIQDQIFKLRVQRAIGQEVNPLKTVALKRDIARLKTVQTEQARKGQE